MEILSSFEKLFQAHEHISSTQVLLDQAREETVYEWVRFDNAQVASDPYLKAHWRAKVRAEADWSPRNMFLGDAIQNMRSSLDHAVAELMRRQHGLTDEEVQDAHVQFPIAATRREFKNQTRWLDRAVDAELAGTLERLQELPEGNPVLMLLRDLSNLDKHRALAVVDQSTLEVTIDAPGLDIIDIRTKPTRIEDGKVLVSMRAHRPAGSAPLDLNLTIKRNEAIYFPDRELLLPLALTIEAMFIECLAIATQLLGEYLGEPERWFLNSHFEGWDERLANIRGTLPEGFFDTTGEDPIAVV
jgi:hypothetical protein